MEPNPYESPREQGYRTPDEIAYRSLVRDRILLWATGWGAFFGFWGLSMLGVFGAWLLGYID